jgi:hypothetical protein
VKSPVGFLIGIVVLAWVAVSYPAWRLGGSIGLLMSAVAAGLCLVPAVATFLWGQRVLGGSPTDQMQHVFLGTTLRLFFVLGGGMALYFGVEEFNRTAFWLWVMGFYLATLGLETLLLLYAARTRPTGLTGSNPPSA